jgi:hypothetical protein
VNPANYHHPNLSLASGTTALGSVKPRHLSQVQTDPLPPEFTTLPSEVNLRYRAVFPIIIKRALYERTKLPVELVFKKPFFRIEVLSFLAACFEIDLLKE